MERTKEIDIKAQTMKDNLFCSPSRQNKTQREAWSPNIYGASELFNEIRNIINIIVESFNHPEYLWKLPISEENSLKDIWNKLEKYQLCNILGFVSIIAKLMSIKITWDKLLSNWSNNSIIKTASSIQYNSVEHHKPSKGK